MSKVLVVDDSKSVHAFLRDCFSGTGVELLQAMDGKQCLEQLDALADPANPGKSTVDLILLDWEMPVLDGPGTYAELKRRHNHIPVIMMTSRNSMDDITLMVVAGVSEYIMKPFTRDILIDKIRSVVSGILE